MPILTEKDLLQSVLPSGWRVIEAWVEGKDGYDTIILNPVGKRYGSLEAVHEALLEQTGIEGIKKHIENIFSKKYKVESLELTEVAKLKRKRMAMKNPFRNLLKRTLEKNHVVTASKKKRSYDYHKYLAKRKREKRMFKGL